MSNNLNAFKQLFPIFLRLSITASETNDERTVLGVTGGCCQTVQAVSLEKLSMEEALSVLM